MQNNKIVTSSENPGRPVWDHLTGWQIRGSLRHPWRLGKRAQTYIKYYSASVAGISFYSATSPVE